MHAGASLATIASGAVSAIVCGVTAGGRAIVEGSSARPPARGLPMLVYVLAGHEVLGRIAVGRRALRRSEVRLRDPLFSRRYVLARVRGLGTEARWLEIEPRDVMVVHRLPGFRDTFP